VQVSSGLENQGENLELSCFYIILIQFIIVIFLIIKIVKPEQVPATTRVDSVEFYLKKKKNRIE
jgi:hypothetical protein